jgi:hypothetical protein
MASARKTGNGQIGDARRLEGRCSADFRRRFPRFDQGRTSPNAAKVFINWFLSRRGHIALQKYEDLYGDDPPNSRRIDIPKDMLPPSSRLVEGRRYFDFSEAKYADMTPIFQLAKEFMKGREGK